MRRKALTRPSSKARETVFALICAVPQGLGAPMAWWLAQQNPKTKSPGEVARAFVDPGCSVQAAIWAKAKPYEHGLAGAETVFSGEG
ncbi:MAG: hypothetical protein LBI76_15985 [Comamonas sp.]|nr:hypothetical protein [Comamonas sp.]